MASALVIFLVNLLLLAVAVSPRLVAGADEQVGSTAVTAVQLAGSSPRSGRANALEQVAEAWHANTPRDLHREYNRIFRYGNRNAASHLWVKFLLERSHQMSHEKLVGMFQGFCAVSGSPVGPHNYNRYKLSLDKVDGSGLHAGFMHYCCWPCVCDTHDFIRVDTRNVSTLDGERQYHFAVIGNPCDRPEALRAPFNQFGRRMTTLEQVAQEVRCEGDQLVGAPLSDHGYVIIAMIFDLPAGSPDADTLLVTAENAGAPPTPGRMRDVQGVQYQDEYEYDAMCEDRKQRGYNSGMGEIFRKVAEISPIPIPAKGPAVDSHTLQADRPTTPARITTADIGSNGSVNGERELNI